MDEFSIIKKFFYKKTESTDKNIHLGQGDDAAVFSLEPGQAFVTSIDTLNSGVHFPEDCSPEDIAFKALAVNLSDLAAMGAKPHSFTLSLSMPYVREDWLESFSGALFELASQYGIELIGGDTCKGSLSVTVSVFGTVENEKFMTRSAVQENDLLCVTGHPGLAALGLNRWQKENFSSEKGNLPFSELPDSVKRFLRPEPRVNFAMDLLDLGVKAAIDISDGLLSEIVHLCDSSRKSMELDLGKLCSHDEFTGLPEEEKSSLILGGGDDYELCFSVAPELEQEVKSLALAHGLSVSFPGKFIARQKCAVLDVQGKEIHAESSGYKHF